MKHLICLLALFAVASTAEAANLETIVFPADVPPAPVADGHAHGTPVELYTNVKYKDTKKIPCCAVPKIVHVQDPCWRPDPCNPCCKPPCVAVKICVPKACNTCCGPQEDLKCRRDGKQVVYKQGKYKVVVTSRKGHVVVDYD